MANKVEEVPFALPLAVDSENYRDDYVIHDANWRRVAAVRKTQINAKARAEFLRDAVNSYAAFEAMKEALEDTVCHNCENRIGFLGKRQHETCPSCKQARAALKLAEQNSLK